MSETGTVDPQVKVQELHKLYKDLPYRLHRTLNRDGTDFKLNLHLITDTANPGFLGPFQAAMCAGILDPVPTKNAIAFPIIMREAMDAVSWEGEPLTPTHTEGASIIAETDESGVIHEYATVPYWEFDPNINLSTFLKMLRRDSPATRMRVLIYPSIAISDMMAKYLRQRETNTIPEIIEFEELKTRVPFSLLRNPENIGEYFAQLNSAIGKTQQSTQAAQDEALA